MFVSTFRRLQTRSLHGYFDAIHFAFNDFVQNPRVAELNVYAERRQYIYLINGNNHAALFKGVVMRTSMYLFFLCMLKSV